LSFFLGNELFIVYIKNQLVFFFLEDCFFIAVPNFEPSKLKKAKEGLQRKKDFSYAIAITADLPRLGFAKLVELPKMTLLP